MRKIYGLCILSMCTILLLSACANKNTDNANFNTKNLMLCELPESQTEEQIGNQIPQWVSDADWNLSMHIMTSTDLEEFDNYAKDNFPTYYDDGWTPKQSEEVYLGQGIEMFELDDLIPEIRIVYYPVILNGVIVSGYQVYEQLDSHEMHMQGDPNLVNQLNALMQQMAQFDVENTLVLGYNNGNTIGIIGSDNGSNMGIVWNSYYILDVDHMLHREVDVNVIPNIDLEESIVVDAMEPLCTERKAAETGFPLRYDGYDTGTEILFEDCICEYDGAQTKVYSYYVDNTVFEQEGYALYIQTTKDTELIFPVKDYLVDQDETTLYMIWGISTFERIQGVHFQDSLVNYKIESISSMESLIGEAYGLALCEDGNDFGDLQVEFLGLFETDEKTVLRGTASALYLISGEKYSIEWEIETESLSESVKVY